MCRSAGKGVKALEAAGLLEAEPAAVAQFLRDHEAVLDRAQVTWLLSMRFFFSRTFRMGLQMPIK